MASAQQLVSSQGDTLRVSAGAIDLLSKVEESVAVVAVAVGEAYFRKEEFPEGVEDGEYNGDRDET